jgi:hypothetical protein
MNMRRWIGSGALLMLGLLTGCGGESSETPQASPKPKTVEVIDKDGNKIEVTSLPGPDEDKEKETRGQNGSAAKK